MIAKITNIILSNSFYKILDSFVFNFQFLDKKGEEQGSTKPQQKVVKDNYNQSSPPLEDDIPF